MAVRRLSARTLGTDVTLERPLLDESPAFSSWPIWVLFGGLPLWWYLGASGFIVQLLAVPMLISLAVHGRTRAPKIFVLWILFLLWTFLSFTQLVTASNFTNYASYIWRVSLYIVATIMFLYVYNASREKLPASAIVKALTLFWVLAILGGFIGMFVPRYSITSIVERLLPGSIASNGFVKVLVHPETTRNSAFPGTAIFRPKAPFIFSNQWASVYPLTLPFAIAALTKYRSRLWRDFTAVLIVLSIIPLVFTLSRGGWLSTVALALYAGFRLAAGKNGRATRAFILGTAVVAALVLFSPLGQLITYRLNNGFSDTSRRYLVASTFQLVQQRPFLGYGVPVDTSANALNPKLPSVGTHGQAWLVLIMSGIPAFAFYLGWFGMVLLRTGWKPRAGGRRDSWTEFWCHCVVVVGLVQIGFDELFPWQFPIIMIAAAVALREASLRPHRLRISLKPAAANGAPLWSESPPTRRIPAGAAG